MEKPEIFQIAEIPSAFSTRRQAGKVMSSLQEGSVVLGQTDVERLVRIKTLLEHPDLENLIDEGRITLGIIKPHANEGRGLPQDDEEAADVLLGEIGQENIIFAFSATLNGSQVERFYRDVIQKYSQITNDRGQTIWDTIYNFIQSGPLTFLLIYRDNDAINWWRNKMGSTRPSEADPQSIRGRYALQENLPNNLTHGSDSAEAVKKEVMELRGIIEDIISTSTSQ